jgi:hypothetical protein
MTKKANSEVHFISPDAYPQMMSKQAAAQAMKVLRSAQTEVKAQVAMEAHVPPMRAAILQYVDELEEAGGDMPCVFDKVHEIRGFAETAGLVTTGRIADILCRYMDDMYRIGKPLDTMIVTLHVSAIARAARAEDDDVKMGEVVAGELAALVAQRLADASR